MFLDNDNMSDLKEGAYVIRSFNRLTPLDPWMDERIGGLVGLTIQMIEKKVKTVVEDDRGVMFCKIMPDTFSNKMGEMWLIKIPEMVSRADVPDYLTMELCQENGFVVGQNLKRKTFLSK